MQNAGSNGAGGRGHNPQDEMDALQKKDGVEKPIIPTCGKCGAGRAAPWQDGAPIVMTNLQMGPMLLGVFACGNPDCGCIYSIQILQMAVPRPPEKALIERV